MRVLLVDDHALFRAGLASLLGAWSLKVVGQAGNGREAIERARDQRLLNYAGYQDRVPRDEDNHSDRLGRR